MATDEDLRGFFAQHDARLCRLGFLLTGDPAQAEELAQDALVRTWRRWRLVGRPDNPGTYARKVLVNRHRSLLRRALVEARYRYRDRLDARSGDEHREDAIVLWAATVGCHRANRPCWCCATTRTSARPAVGLGRWFPDPSAVPTDADGLLAAIYQLVEDPACAPVPVGDTVQDRTFMVIDGMLQTLLPAK